MRGEGGWGAVVWCVNKTWWGGRSGRREGPESKETAVGWWGKGREGERHCQARARSSASAHRGDPRGRRLARGSVGEGGRRDCGTGGRAAGSGRGEGKQCTTSPTVWWLSRPAPSAVSAPAGGAPRKTCGSPVVLVCEASPDAAHMFVQRQQKARECDTDVVRAWWGASVHHRFGVLSAGGCAFPTPQPILHVFPSTCSLRNHAPRSQAPARSPANNPKPPATRLNFAGFGLHPPPQQPPLPCRPSAGRAGRRARLASRCVGSSCMRAVLCPWAPYGGSQ